MALHRSDLPPLELLRAFEAAARNLSFTRAAAELFVTQSAISRQVKALEDDLGTPLFERRHRALALTDAGQTLYRTTLDVFERLRDAARRLREARGRRSFTVTTTVGFAALWLVPRLPRFTVAHPGLDVRISAGNRVMDLERDDIDVAVRFLPREKAPGPPLFGEEVQPVCSPSLLADRSRPLAEPADLRRHVLLVTMDPGAATPWTEWPPWLESVGQAGLEPAGTLHFSQYDLLVNAAIAGQGVALGRMPLLRDAVQDGRLVFPFRRSIASPRAYYLVASRRARDDPLAHAFRDWLHVEAAADRVGASAPPIVRPRRPRPPRSSPPRRSARPAGR